MLEPECRMTKQALKFINRYNNSNIVLYNIAIIKPSKAKQRAFDLIQKQFEYLNGRGMRVLTSGTYFFSVGYVYNTEDGTYLRVETYAHTYDFRVKEIQDETNMQEL